MAKEEERGLFVLRFDDDDDEAEQHVKSCNKNLLNNKLSESAKRSSSLVFNVIHRLNMIMILPLSSSSPK